MKLTNLLKSTLIIAAIALIPGIASAQQAIEKNSPQSINTDINTNNYLQPFNLVFLAYQGNLKEQGIPSGNSLIFEYQTGNLRANDLVNAAVKANKLPTQILNDQSYLSAVESQLISLSTNLSN